MSTAMICFASDIAAPCITERPIPRPKTATVAPFSTLAALATAPIPVVTPHPRRQTLSRELFYLFSLMISQQQQCTQQKWTYPYKDTPVHLYS